jgi:hypothetical protein
MDMRLGLTILVALASALAWTSVLAGSGAASRPPSPNAPLLAAIRSCDQPSRWLIEMARVTLGTTKVLARSAVAVVDGRK